MPRKAAAPPTQQQEQTQDQVIQTAAPAQEMPPIHLDVRVRPIAQKGNLLGYASVNINGAFAVDGIKVVNGKNGLFVSMPSYQDGKGQYKDIAFPITAEFRKQLNEAVVTEYQQTLEQMQTASVQQGQTREAPAMADPAMA
jgi:stage V sporulation protein G